MVSVKRKLRMSSAILLKIAQGGKERASLLVAPERGDTYGSSMPPTRNQRVSL